MKEIVYYESLSNKEQFAKCLNWFEGIFDNLQIDKSVNGLKVFFPGGMLEVKGNLCYNKFNVIIKILYRIESAKDRIVNDLQFIILLFKSL